MSRPDESFGWHLPCHRERQGVLVIMEDDVALDVRLDDKVGQFIG